MLCRYKDKVNFVGGAFSMDTKIYDYNVSSFSYMYIYYLTETKIFDINIHITKSTVTSSFSEESNQPGHMPRKFTLQS